jgi:hypothetical protein
MPTGCLRSAGRPHAGHLSDWCRRIDGDNRDAFEHRLVCQELAKLQPRTTMQTVALCPCGLNPPADVRQVLRHAIALRQRSGSNNLLGHALVGLLAKAGFLIPEFLQMMLGTLKCGAVAASHGEGAYLALANAADDAWAVSRFCKANKQQGVIQFRTHAAPPYEDRIVPQEICYQLWKHRLEEFSLCFNRCSASRQGLARGGFGEAAVGAPPIPPGA